MLGGFSFLLFGCGLLSGFLPCQAERERFDYAKKRLELAKEGHESAVKDAREVGVDVTGIITGKVSYTEVKQKNAKISEIEDPIVRATVAGYNLQVANKELEDSKTELDEATRVLNECQKSNR